MVGRRESNLGLFLIYQAFNVYLCHFCVIPECFCKILWILYKTSLNLFFPLFKSSASNNQIVIIFFFFLKLLEFNSHAPSALVIIELIRVTSTFGSHVFLSWARKVSFFSAEIAWDLNSETMFSKTLWMTWNWVLSSLFALCCAISICALVGEDADA